MKTVLPYEEYCVTASVEFNIVIIVKNKNNNGDLLFLTVTMRSKKILDLTHPLVIIVSYDLVFI